MYDPTHHEFKMKMKRNKHNSKIFNKLPSIVNKVVKSHDSPKASQNMQVAANNQALNHFRAFSPEATMFGFKQGNGSPTQIGFTNIIVEDNDPKICLRLAQARKELKSTKLENKALKERLGRLSPTNSIASQFSDADLNKIYNQQLHTFKSNRHMITNGPQL